MIYTNYRIISGVFLGLVLFFTSCGGGKSDLPGSRSAEKATPPPPLARAYIFNESEILSLEPGALGEELDRLNTAFIPWVNQIRVVDFFEKDGVLHFPVNRLGFGRIVFNGAFPRIVFPEKEALFRNRTLGRAFTHEDFIICQFYGDRVFSNAPSIGGPALFGFSPGDDGRFIPTSELPVLSDRGVDEELAEMTVINGRWYLAWKTLSRQEVSFRYQEYLPSEGISESLLPEDYRGALVPRPVSEAPADIRRLQERLCIQDEEDRQIDLIDWSFADGSPDKTWFSGRRELLFSGAGDLRFCFGFSDSAGRPFLLDPESAVFWYAASQGGVPEKRTLPELPSSCVYTGISVLKGYAVLSWEEQIFPAVGASGLMVVKL